MSAGFCLAASAAVWVLAPKLLTVVSPGTRVALAYALAPLPAFGANAIWAAVPIGWVLADLAGFGYYAFLRKRSDAA